MKNFLKYIGVAAVIMLSGNGLYAQWASDSAARQWVESRNFIFKAESVFPQQGRSRQLTSEYDLTISRDTISSFLPYFGRAYSAPVNPSEGGIKFTSVKFDYQPAKEKKGRWEILIKPDDAQDVRELYLTVYNNGRATLRVNSVNRQTISFNGYIIEGPARAKKAF